MLNDEDDAALSNGQPSNEIVLYALPPDNGDWVTTYEEDLPTSITFKDLTQRDAVAFLHSIFVSANVNKMRSHERGIAFSTNPSSDPVPLADYEHIYHMAQLVEILLERGMMYAEHYCRERDFMAEDAKSLIADATQYIVSASNQHAAVAKEMAIARYNKLFERLYSLRDFKGAALVQRCIDKLTGVESSLANGDTGNMQSLLQVMNQIAAETPNPLLNGNGSPQLGPVAKGVKTVVEVPESGNISEAHKVEDLS